MLHRSSSVVGAAVFAAFWFTSAVIPAGAQSAASKFELPAFSATQVLPMGKYDISSKVYHSGKGVRAQYNDVLGRLFLPADRKVYNFTRFPDGSTQCVWAAPEAGMGYPNLLELLSYTVVTRTPVGKELVDGHNASVENVVVKRSNGKTAEFKVWLADDLKGVPVKIESSHTGAKMTAVYRDYVFDAPDAALFTVPAKCIPIEKMGQVVEQTNQ